MADVNYGTQFLGFDDNGYQGEDLTISPPRYHPNVGGDTPPRYKANVDSIPMPVQEGRDSIPHAAHEGESSFASTSFDSEAGFGPKIVSMSFDSEAGYGAKISDFVDYVEELEKPEDVPGSKGSNGTYDLSAEAEEAAADAAGEGVAKKLTFVPESFASPPRSVDVSSNVFKAYDFDKTFTPKLSKSEFEFNDAQSPVSASKYIERSLHDLDDLINLRRLELSELKRSHSQRPGSTQEYSNPLHQGKNSTSRLSSPNPVNGSDGSPNPAASPSMTIPKATYESMRDKERNATQMLKAEQAKVKRLELQYQDLEFQNSMHLERLSVVKAEKLRLDNEAAQGGEEARSLSGEVQHLKDQLMARNNHVVELEKEVRALQEEIKERILEEARNKESRDKENREREEKEREREMREKEREREVFETPSPSESQKNLRDSDSVSADKGERERERDTANGNDEEKKCNTFSSPHASTDMAMKFSELQAEADQLRARCETAEGLNIDLAQQVEAMVQLRETLELEKSNANLVAFQWHGEASLLETDLKSSQEECSELKRKTEEVETVVMAKDEKIAALVLILQETLEREKEREREDEAKRVFALKASSSSAPPKDLGPPPMASTPAHASASAPPMTAPPMTAPLSVTPSADDPDNFWSDQKSPEGLHHGMDSTTKTGASASLAKRVLITWDRTPGGRVKPSAPRSTGAISFSAFLMTILTD